ncbi:MAG: hypothetical protein AB1486_13030 [Planctomycetota bacterium]
MVKPPRAEPGASGRRKGHGLREHASLLVLIVAAAAALTAWQLEATVFAVGLLAITLPLLLHHLTSGIVRRQGVARGLQESAGAGSPGPCSSRGGFSRRFVLAIACSIVVRLAVSVAIVVGYMLLGWPKTELFALVYAGGYVAAGLLEARSLVLDLSDSRRIVS